MDDDDDPFAELRPLLDHPEQIPFDAAGAVISRVDEVIKRLDKLIRLQQIAGEAERTERKLLDRIAALLMFLTGLAIISLLRWW